MKTPDRVPTMATFQAVIDNPAAVALDWKAQGKKVVGYRCFFIPEEIIWAGGMLPYPLYGTPEPITRADSYLQPCTCEYVRNLFDLALDGRLDFLDFLALSNTCDVKRRFFDNWNKYIEHCPAYILNNPQHLASEANREYFREELDRFKIEMEKLSGERITDQKLRDAIELHNETRALLRELYETRKQNPPLLTGAEAFVISMATTVMPKDRANPLVRKVLDELKNTAPPENFGPRILVTGSTMDHPALIRMVEEEGGQVVIDDLCTTSRYFWDQVPNDADPMEALYRFLNQRVLCPCVHPAQARFDHICALADEFEVEAVMDFTLKYCHPFLLEAPLLKRDLEKRGLPTNVLEVGHDLSGHGQLRTRIQAFLEMIEI